MNTLIAGMLGGPEIWIVCIVILILFGGAAIPKFARSIGQAKDEFEKGVKAAKKPIVEKEDTRGDLAK